MCVCGICTSFRTLQAVIYSTRRDSFGFTSDTLSTITLEVDRVVWAGRPYLQTTRLKVFVPMGVCA